MDRLPSDDSVYDFVGIDTARIKRPVGPGDQLILKAAVAMNRRGMWKFSCKAEVDGQVAAEAELMCTLRTKE